MTTDTKTITDLFNATIYDAKTRVSTVPMIRTHGNGNYTGFDRVTYSDGSVINSTFVTNAASREAAQAAYHETHAAQS